MAAPLALPSFFTGARNDLATQDVYKVGSEKVVNSIQDITKAPDMTEVNRLTGASVKGAVKDAFAILKTVNQLKDSKAGLLDKVFAGTGVLGEAMKRSGLPTDMLSAALTTGKSLTTMITGAKGDITKIKNGNFSSISSLTNLIGVATGQEGLMKAASSQLQGGAVGSVIKLASQNGVPKSFGELTKLIDKNSSTLSRVIDDVLPTALKKSDIGMMKEIAIASPGFQKATIPDTIKDFGFNYSPGPAAADKEPEVIWGEITSTYTKIDPKWLDGSRVIEGVPVTIPDVSKIVEASPALKQTIREAVVPKATKTPQEVALIVAENTRRKQEYADKMNKKYPSDDGPRYFAEGQVKSIWFPPAGWVQPPDFNVEIPYPELIPLD